LTNLDVHDLVRASCTYDLQACFFVTPITAQRQILAEIFQHWSVGAGRARVPTRSAAMRLGVAAHDGQEVVQHITDKHGQRPALWATAARHLAAPPPVSFAAARAQLRQPGPPVLLVFGTGHGLAPAMLETCDALLPPVRSGGYNHLSVRTAVAIILDRLIDESPRLAAAGTTGE
ncbi:MAG: RNA methyltransferase, partial [Polyangiales bacterium]